MHGTALRTFAWSLGGGILVAWALSLAWWALLEPANASDDIYELTIPAGTAAAVAAGQPAPFIPNSLELGRQSSLLIHNQDVVEHRVGTWTIPPGSDLAVEATESDGQLSCTIHPQGVIGVRIDERPPFLMTVLSALGIGVPMGLIVGFATVVGGRLKMGEE